MKVIPLSCRCKLSALVPQVRHYMLVPPSRPAVPAPQSPSGCVILPMNLTPAA